MKKIALKRIFNFPSFLVLLGLHGMWLAALLCTPHSVRFDRIGKMQLHQAYTVLGQILSFNLLNRTLVDWYMVGATLEENIPWYNAYIVRSVVILSPLFVVWCCIGACGVALVKTSLQGVCMKRDIVEVYVLTVGFLALLTFTVFFGIGMYNTVKIWNPELMLGDYTFSVHQTNQKFARTYLQSRDTPLPTDEEITRLREESYHVAIQAEKRSAVQALIRSGIVLVIAGTVAVLHRAMFVNMRRKYE